MLRWPNGETSIGQLVARRRGTLTFDAAEVDGPFAQRCRKADRAARSEINPGPIEVTETGSSDDGDVAHVEPALLDAVQGIYPNMLEDLAETAGGEDDGLFLHDGITLSRVMQGVLRHIEENCTDPVAARHALDALERPFIQFVMRPVDQTDSAAHGYSSCSVVDPEGDDEDEDERDLGERLHALEPGGHLLLRGSQARDGDSHALAVSVTRLTEARVQVNLFNSNGWREVAGHSGFARFPAIGKTVSLEDASAALTALSGGVIERPEAFGSSRGRRIWRSVSGAAPLSAWLRSVDPGSPLQPTGQRMTPQKGGDCAIEVEFAWLASVLPEADYKLAKAHVLNVLMKAAVANDLDAPVLQRLRERVTSSLSAHAMATGG